MNTVSQWVWAVGCAQSSARQRGAERLCSRGSDGDAGKRPPPAPAVPRCCPRPKRHPGVSSTSALSEAPSFLVAGLLPPDHGGDPVTAEDTRSRPSVQLLSLTVSSDSLRHGPTGPLWFLLPWPAPHHLLGAGLQAAGTHPLHPCHLPVPGTAPGKQGAVCTVS